MQPAGTLKTLRRYPVKSMAGEDLSEARVTFGGLAGDRVYAFIDNGNRSNFPWMTARQAHDMLLFRPRFLHPQAVEEEIPDPAQYDMEVVSPEGKSFQLPGDELEPFLEKRYNRDLRLKFSESSMTDARPVSLFALSTMRALGEEAGVPIDPRQFRANFYVQWDEDRPYLEDDFVGREIQIGEMVTIQIVKKDGRCVMINLNPDTAASTPEVLTTVARAHGGFVGVYGAVLREGIVRSGDPVYLL